LEALPRLSSLWFRSREQHHIVRVTDEHDRIANRTVIATPLTIYLVKNDVGKQRREHALLRFSHIPAESTFTTAELHPQTAEAMGCSTADYHLSSLRYDLSKLRAIASAWFF
jgi:hypothetical protein